jgi:hypothetical protein
MVLRCKNTAPEEFADQDREPDFDLIDPECMLWVCEEGGDVGRTWYWNRYPGIACDVESYSYLPLLEEMKYFPTMKFASGFEILEYCQMMRSAPASMTRSNAGRAAVPIS